MKWQNSANIAALALLLGSGLLPTLAAAHGGGMHGGGAHGEWHAGSPAWHGSAGSGAGFPHRHFREHFGVIVGAPLLWDPWPWPPPVAPIYATPQLFLEQGGVPGYYYCPGAGYYPAVGDCPVGWQFRPQGNDDDGE